MDVRIWPKNELIEHNEHIQSKVEEIEELKPPLRNYDTS
jgi:hypothetical protein